MELKRGEQETPFSGYVSSIQAIYGIDVMIQILTALGKETLQRSSGYYSSTTERKAVLSHLLKVCRPKPEETALFLEKATKLSRRVFEVITVGEIPKNDAGKVLYKKLEELP